MKYTDLKGYLIAVDLDDTIVTGFDTIDEESFSVLKELSKSNYIIIATGRPWRSSCYFYNMLNLKTPIINYNGAYVHNPNDKNFEETMITIDKFKLQNFIESNKNILVNVFCEIKDDIFLLNESEEIKPYLHLDGGKLHTGNFNHVLPGNPNGAILFSKVGSENILQEYVNEKYKEVRIRYWFTNDTAVSELYNPKTSKANAIIKICDYYNIDKSKIIAIGDGHNDIEMIEIAKYGVAMANGHKDLLKTAKYKTTSVLEHGVAHFFKNTDF